MDPPRPLSVSASSARLDPRAPCLCVFDLDSTLFDVSPRIEKILQEFAEIEENKIRFADYIQYFQGIKTRPSDWGIKDALVRAGLDGQHPELQQAVRDHWIERFFSNPYLHYDIPYQGAVEFVQKVYQLGCDVVYLTGRDVFRMSSGSAEVLKKWGFPLNSQAPLDPKNSQNPQDPQAELADAAPGADASPAKISKLRAELVLKPHRDLEDASFKTDWFRRDELKAYEKIWFFENEPVNINHLRLNNSKVEVIFFDSTHSRREQAPKDIPKLIHYILDGED